MLESTGLGAVPGVAGRSAEGAVGDRSGSAGGRVRSVGVVPDPELVERPRRRRFSAEYKLRIVREADACSRPGEVGALLRREGLYSPAAPAARATDRRLDQQARQHGGCSLNSRPSCLTGLDRLRAM